MRTIKELKEWNKYHDFGNDIVDAQLEVLKDVVKLINERIDSLDRTNNSWYEERAKELEELKARIEG